MQMSKACMAPIQPAISQSDRQHPLFAEYLRWRSAMSAQLVQADSFINWFNHKKSAEEGERVVEHPRHSEYVVWLRNNVNCKPSKRQWISIWEWEKGGF